MLLYNLVVFLYGAVIRLAAFRNPKAKAWSEGRRGWRKELAKKAEALPGEKIWIHCASYGEFEQGRPLIEAIKKRFPEKKIILSFFSPSGYESFSTWQGADLVCYLPLDLPQNAARFVEIVDPSVAIFVKYEFWLNVLSELRKRGVPTFLVSATFKPHHPFFKSFGGIFRKSLSVFDKIYVQEKNSAELLQGIGISRVEICGDTRFDRVNAIRAAVQPIAEISAFRGGQFMLVAGSTWPSDEELIYQAIAGIPTKVVIVPHHVDAASVERSVKLLEKYKIGFCRFGDKDCSGAQVMLVDRMGYLSKIYQYADLAYVGGGFDEGIHNTLEPAVFGVPVIFGESDFSKFNEAVNMVKMGAAFTVRNGKDLRVLLEEFERDIAHRERVRVLLEKYFAENSNVTERILVSMLPVLARGTTV